MSYNPNDPGWLAVGPHGGSDIADETVTLVRRLTEPPRNSIIAVAAEDIPAGAHIEIDVTTGMARATRS